MSVCGGGGGKLTVIPTDVIYLNDLIQLFFFFFFLLLLLLPPSRPIEGPGSVRRVRFMGFSFLETRFTSESQIWVKDPEDLHSPSNGFFYLSFTLEVGLSGSRFFTLVRGSIKR